MNEMKEKNRVELEQFIVEYPGKSYYSMEIAGERVYGYLDRLEKYPAGTALEEDAYGQYGFFDFADIQEDSEFLLSYDDSYSRENGAGELLVCESVVNLENDQHIMQEQFVTKIFYELED
jgi:hypothetical protein